MLLSASRSTLLCYLVGAYLFFFYMQASLRWDSFQTVRFHFTFGAILSVLCLVKHFSSGRVNKNAMLGLQTPRYRKLKRSVFWLILILAVYTLFSLDPVESRDVFINRFLKFVMISFFICVAVENENGLKVILLCILLAWFKILFEGFWGWLGGGMMWQNQGIMRLHGAAPFVRHPNSFSAFALGTIAFCIAFWPHLRSPLEKIAVSAMFLFSMVIILFTGSRSGYVTILLASVYLFFKLKKNKLKIFLAVCFACILFAGFIPSQYVERLESIYTGEEAEGDSGGTRLVIMQDAMEVLKIYPFGVGVQAFPSVRVELFDRFQNVHMLYLEVLTNVGPLGLIIFLMLVYRIIRLAIENVESGRAKDKNFLVAVNKFAIIFISFRLVFGIFAMDLYEPHWWLMVGLIMSSSFILSREKYVERTDFRS